MQHNRQLIREQFGILEEKLEELSTLAFTPEQATPPDSLVQDALESVRELSRLVHDQQILKSIPAHDFLLRICALLVQDAAKEGVDLAISHYGEGKISMEMAELVLGAVVAGFRASLKSQLSITRVQRLKNHLFATGSLYIEVKASANEIQFRLLDDGQGFGSGSDRRFQKLREHIARCGGWFGHKSFSPCGGIIEFKVPLALNRAGVYVLKQGTFEALVPSACVVEVAQEPGPDAVVFRLHETEGLIETAEKCAAHLRIGVADLQFWIGCDSIGGPVQARRASADDLVEEGCWMRSLGVFQEAGLSRALPLLDGPTLLHFQGGVEK